jgi:hypothetical protein
VATLLPLLLGLKATVTVQLAPAATVPPAKQVPPVVKSAASVPPKVMALSVAVPLPLLSKVSVLALPVAPTLALATAKLVAPPDQASTPVALLVPVPLRLMLLGEVLALLTMRMDAVLAPLLVGVKVAVMVQLLLAARLLGQLWLTAKWPLALARARLLSVRALLPLLVKVTVLVLLALSVSVP